MTAPKAVRHLSPAELSERLGVPAETLKRWRRTGAGPRFLRVGRHIRYRTADVEAWEKTRLVTTAA
jgi:excisionase family DNA binding protein